MARLLIDQMQDQEMQIAMREQPAKPAAAAAPTAMMRPSGAMTMAAHFAMDVVGMMVIMRVVAVMGMAFAMPAG
ncbi:MAG: hypothetical protein VB101_01775 [Rhodospirillaceae bacterium]|nr:hypothetical protein [Rhodospirillaceae bacterium]